MRTLKKQSMNISNIMKIFSAAAVMTTIGCHQKKKAPASISDLEQYVVLVEGEVTDDKGNQQFVKYTFQDKDDDLKWAEDYFIYGRLALKKLPRSVLEDKQLIPHVHRILAARVMVADWTIDFFERSKDLENELKILKTQRSSKNEASSIAIKQKENRILEVFNREHIFMSKFHQEKEGIQIYASKYHVSSVDIQKIEMLVTKAIQYAKEDANISPTEQEEIDDYSARVLNISTSLETPIVLHPPKDGGR